MALISSFARWLYKKAISPGSMSLQEWQFGRPYFPDVSHRALIDKYIGWVYACANNNAQSCAQIPLRLYSNKPAGKSAKCLTRKPELRQLAYMKQSASVSGYIAKTAEVEEVLEHPFLELMKKANPFMNQFDLFELFFLSLDMVGNAYWYLVKNGMFEYPTEIWPMFSQYMKIIPDKTKFISHYEYSVDGINKREFKPERIVHFKYMGLKDAYYGVGPLQACVMAADLSSSMNQYETGLMENRAHPDFGIKLPPEAGIPSEKEQKRVEKKWFQKFKGKTKAGKPVWLYGGADIVPLSLSPKELSFLQGRKATLNEIAAVFGNPMSMLTAEDVNRANAEAGEYSYMKNTIRPRLQKAEQKLNENLLPLYAENLFVAFDNPVPEDKEFRLKQQETHIKTGYSAIDEERQIDGLEESGWGSIPYLPNNLVPIGSVVPEAVSEGDKTIKHKASRRLPPLGHPTNFIDEPFVESMQEYFREMRYEILGKFDEDFKGVESRDEFGAVTIDYIYQPITHTKPAGDYISGWFDMQKWNTALAERTEPFIRATLLGGGERALAQLTTETRFDPLAPKVMTALERHRTGSMHINGNTIKKLRKTLANGIEEGEGIADLRRRLEDEFDGLEKYQATMIARTETIWAFNEGAVQGYIQSGLVERKEWVSSGDPRTCDECLDLDGTIVVVAGDFFDKGDTFGRYLFDYEAINHPPLHPQCRCTIVPVIEGY